MLARIRGRSVAALSARRSPQAWCQGLPNLAFSKVSPGSISQLQFNDMPLPPDKISKVRVASLIEWAGVGMATCSSFRLRLAEWRDPNGRQPELTVFSGRRNRDRPHRLLSARRHGLRQLSLGGWSMVAEQVKLEKPRAEFPARLENFGSLLARLVVDAHAIP